MFFACVDQDRVYFKVDDATRADYESRGMAPFKPMPNMTLKTYYEVPAEVLEQPDELAAWARRAIACQSQTKSKPRDTKLKAKKAKKAKLKKKTNKKAASAKAPKRTRRPGGA